jgi:hypothetical protein
MFCCIHFTNIVNHFLGAFAKLWKVAISFVMCVLLSVCLHGTTLASTGQIFMKFDIWVLFENLVERIQVSVKSDKINGYFTSGCRENQNTNFLFSDFFLTLCYLWDNVEKYDRARQAVDDNIIQYMRCACWISKVTDTHSEYVILMAFSQ